MKPTMKDILDLLEQFRGPNGAFVLLIDDNHETGVRTQGSPMKLLGLIQWGGEAIQESIYAKMNEVLKGEEHGR